jgi:MFS family permease
VWDCDGRDCVSIDCAAVASESGLWMDGEDNGVFDASHHVLSSCVLPHEASTTPDGAIGRMERIQRVAVFIVCDWHHAVFLGPVFRVLLCEFSGCTVVTSLALFSDRLQIGAYGVAVLGTSEQESITLLLILNASGVPGRLLPNFVADLWLGPLNTMIPFAAMSAVLLYCWIAVNSVPNLIIFAVFYGTFSSGLLSLFPAALSSLGKDPTKAGVRMGMVMTCISFACLTGPPIGGALIVANKGGYVPAQIFFGSVVVAGVGFLTAVRIAVAGWKLKIKA